MLSRTVSLGISGIEARIVDVEVDIVKGLPNFTIVGLPDSTVKESKDRIRSAIENSGFDFPPKNYIVNLAPAGFRKQGANFDLAIALAILNATGQIDIDVSLIPLVGELSLDGKVKPVRGIISMAIELFKRGYKKMIVPSLNVAEASAIEEIEVFPVEHITDVFSVYAGKVRRGEPVKISAESILKFDFRDVCGQESVKRAVEIAAAGHHNILMYGPPGSGKTMVAKCIPSILPQLSRGESIETTMIHSSGGILESGLGLIQHPPFRMPHHTSSDAALVGGGHVPSVGEISFAHNGILFLDEFSEFKNNVIQSLRQPLEDHEIHVARASGTFRFPADFMFVASSNPCPCGYLFDRDVKCKCNENQVKSFFRKIAGPILDRIDMDVYVPRVEYKDLFGRYSSEPSSSIRGRVEEARLVQKERFKNSGTSYNSRMTSDDVKSFCRLEESVADYYESAVKKLNLSARSFFRVLKVARTIADLDRSESIGKKHVTEALSYKSLQRHYDV